MVLQPKRILWPTDFSELSRHGGHYARAFAQQFDAEVRVVHVVPPPMTADVTIVMPAEVPLAYPDQELLANCRATLERVAQEEMAGVTRMATDVLSGNPWSAICDYATQHTVDLIVVATHGRTGLRHVLIGSTAERIVQHAPCPVLVVKHEAQDFLSEP